jgi:Kef-type K+ transport system membrane component KefB
MLLLWCFVSAAPAQELATSKPSVSPSTASAAEPEVLVTDPESIGNAEDHPRRLERLPPLVRFMIAVTALLVVPSISRACRVPPVVGFIVTGILCGPNVLGFSRHTAPVLATFAEIGRLLLLFYAGMELDLGLLRKARLPTSVFGVATCVLPLLAGTALGLAFGYSLVASVLIGSLLASHTLLGYPVVKQYRLTDREPIIVAVGATIFTDTASLVILAICVSIHTSGFSVTATGAQLVQIAVYIVVVIYGFGHLARWFLKRFQPKQEVQMVLLLFVVLGAALLAELIHLESIVGAFMAGVAVNEALRGTPTHEHIDLLGNSLFLPFFFLSVGLAIDLPVVWWSIVAHFWFVVLMTGTLITAKFLAGWLTGTVFRYPRFDWLNMWSLSLPQVAATIAAALVAYHAVDARGHRLIDPNVLSSVLVMVLVTAILGPILTEAKM